MLRDYDLCLDTGKDCTISIRPCPRHPGPPRGLAGIWCSCRSVVICFSSKWSNVLMHFVAVTSMPPLIGHTTFTTLCGFAYGIKGILIAGPASSIGSALVFILLRTLFSRRLTAWSRGNEKWQALETVIVCTSDRRHVSRS